MANITPLDEMCLLGQALDNRVLIKREDLQPIYSFKIRGAYNRMAKIPARDRRKGVIAASAGNHAQGVAISSRKLGIPATIVMPVTTPSIKVSSVRGFGGKLTTVVMHGDRFEDACRHANELAAKSGALLVHPYDDPDVIAGQGTIAMEIANQFSEHIDALFVPVGGGGLIAGISVYMKYVRPETKIIGVEAAESACFDAALRAGRRVRLPHTGIFADGVAVSQIGRETFRIARKFVDDVITIPNDEICAAIKLMFDDTRSIAEPSGALSLAGLIRYARDKRWHNRTLAAIHSGANTNFDRLRYVSERYAIGQDTEALFAVTIGEKPGTLVALCKAFKGHDISEFNYRYDTEHSARIFVGVKVKPGEKNLLARRLKQAGYDVTDLSGNDLAKMHVCHMVGGHPRASIRERLFSFEFPERPGILAEFLHELRDRWSVSLFHYRQHGGCYAHVFIGLQEVGEKKHSLDKFIDELGFPCTEETDNPAYRYFLS